MNHIILMGRLVKDPDVSYANSGTTIGRFTIAVDRRFKREGQPEADFFNCTTFGKQAEFVEKYLKKGTKILLSGELQNNNYTDKDGVAHYSVSVIVNEIEFAESKKSQTENNSGAGNKDFMNIPEGLEEELPFK
jgi:single-strand DNA-binding protein